MIDQVRPMAVEERKPSLEPPGPLETWTCMRCKNTIAQGLLSVGSYVEIRCHQSIRLPDGTRKTCGWLMRATPSR